MPLISNGKVVFDPTNENNQLNFDLGGTYNNGIITIGDKNYAFIYNEYEKAMEECLSALSAASALHVPYLGILPGKGGYELFSSSIKELVKAAGDVSIAVLPFLESAVDGLKGAERLVSDNPSVSIILDPVALLHDERENTFSFFEEVFSLIGDRIVALLLRDSLEGHAMNIGKGIMAKTYPRISALLSKGIPLIRAGLESASIADDLLYIKKTFF